MTHGGDRAAIVAALREIAARLKLAGENRFRARAYSSGADAVEALSDAALLKHVEAGTLTDVPGVGVALAGVVTALAHGGRVDVLEQLRAAAPAALLELSQIPGVTVRRARKLHEALGVENVDQLAAAARAGRVREVKGFGAKTEAAILASIDEYRRRPQAIRLSDAFDFESGLAAFVASCPGVTRVEAAGGVRRWEEVIEEVSVVATTRSIGEQVLNAVAHYPPLARVESRSPDRLIGRLANGVRVRVRLTSESTGGLAMVEETGPIVHVDALQARARQRGIAWDRLVAPDEASLYAALALPLIPVEARGWTSLPPPEDLDDLVRADDIQGMVHCHTTFSDGRNTIEEMARAADARGASYMTITDHSPTASYAGGLTVERLQEQWDEIARVQEQVKVRLLRGTESDILADGGLDYPDAVLEKLDVIIASIHKRYRLDAAAMTERLVRAMQLPLFKIWGHALGRLILRREPIACDVEAVLGAVASSRAAIEISGDPFRLDLPPAWIPQARQRGIRFVISTDAHAVSDLDNLSYGIAMARRGGVRRQEVLNTLSAAQFRAAVRP